MTTPKKKVEEKKQPEKIHWKDHKRKGNKFSTKVEPRMLAGIALKLSKGSGGGDLVKYDKDYVCAKFCHEFINPLPNTSKEDLHDIVDKAWDFYQSGEYELSR